MKKLLYILLLSSPIYAMDDQKSIQTIEISTFDLSTIVRQDMRPQSTMVPVVIIDEQTARRLSDPRRNATVQTPHHDQHTPPAVASNNRTKIIIAAISSISAIAAAIITYFLTKTNC